jgi:hypothetical protein
MPALVAGIHVLRMQRKAWMAGSSPAMTPGLFYTFRVTLNRSLVFSISIDIPADIGTIYQYMLPIGNLS